jgi:hypothetical protein
MPGDKNLVVRILYFSGILLILRLLWLASVLMKAFPLICVLLAGFLGIMIFTE